MTAVAGCAGSRLEAFVEPDLPADLEFQSGAGRSRGSIKWRNKAVKLYKQFKIWQFYVL